MMLPGGPFSIWVASKTIRDPSGVSPAYRQPSSGATNLRMLSMA
jgi:hypothetical protein